MVFEAGKAETPGLSNDYFYERLNVSESSVRNYVKNLRDDHLVRTESGEHEVIVENLPRAFDVIDDMLGSDSG